MNGRSQKSNCTWKNVIERLQRLAFGPSFYSDWQPSSIKTVFYKISMTAWVFSNQQKSHRFTKKFSSNLELETTIQILAPHGRTMSSTHQNMKSSNILLAVWNSKPSHFHKSKGPSSFSESKFRRFIKIPDSSSVLYFPQILKKGTPFPMQNPKLFRYFQNVIFLRPSSLTLIQPHLQPSLVPT